MTKRLYYEDSFKKHFTATVLECQRAQNLYAIKLDQSAFFPGGGGQPEDYGTINGQVVYKLIEEGETLCHMVEHPFEIGQKVEGKINFSRRLDFMQQHSGEHILSGIIERLYGYSNVGFHLSEETVTADFDGILTENQIREIEKLANEAIREDQAVVCKVYTKEQLETKVFRSKKVFEHDVRLVSIGESDCCACCGVHVKRAGQIGLIKILSAQKHRGGMRLMLKCGLRALEDYENKLNQNREISRLLSVPIEEVTSGVRGLWEEKQDLKQKLYSIEEKYFNTLIETISSHGPICRVEEGLTPDGLRRLMSKLFLKTSWPCFILVPEEGGFKYALGQRDQTLLPLCKALNEAFEGRGGGKDICQGSLKGELSDIQERFKELVFASQGK